MREILSLGEGNRALQQAYILLEYDHTGKGEGPHSMREILSLGEGNRALQQAYSTVILPLRKGSRAP